MSRYVNILIAAGICWCSSLSSQAEDKFWSDNKLTPAQPFPGKVCAVATLWPGYNLLIEEIGGNRICMAEVWMGQTLKYSVLDPGKGETKEDPKCLAANGTWTYLTPAIDVNRFSWSLGAIAIGRRFGDQDLLRKVADFQKAGK